MIKNMFMYNYSDANYPFVSEADISQVKSLFEGLTLVSSETVYLTSVTASGARFSGTLETAGGAFGNFSGGFETPLPVLSSSGSVLGYIYPGVAPFSNVVWAGSVAVSPLCVSPAQDAEESVLALSFGGYIGAVVSSSAAVVSVSAEFRGDQALDSRQWDKEGSLLSINGVTSPIGSLKLNIDAALGTFDVGVGSILLSTPAVPNFVCTGTNAWRDAEIQLSSVLGESLPLPLDPVVSSWIGVDA